MLRNLLGVQKLGKQNKRERGEIFATAESTFNVGMVQYVGQDLAGKFSVGQKVYFGNQREEIRMGDSDIMVMEEKNVFAIVEETNEEAASIEAPETPA